FVCFTKEPNSYIEVALDSGDVSWEPAGSALEARCGPPKPKSGALEFFSSALAATIFAEATPGTSNFDYKEIRNTGLCNWRSKVPALEGKTLVICDPKFLSAPNPGPNELKTYLLALQTEQTDAGTKTGVLKKLLELNDTQIKALDQLSRAHTVFCDDE